MKTYLFDTLNRFRRFSENLDVKATLCNKPWQVFNDSGEKELYIFQEDGTLLITYSGRVTHSTWQYIAANKSIVISAGEQSYMVHPAFMDNVLFALQVDGTNECAFLIDENNAQSFAPRSYTALMGYFEEKERRLLEEERCREQLVIKRQHQKELEEEQRRIKEEEERKYWHIYTLYEVNIEPKLWHWLIWSVVALIPATPLAWLLVEVEFGILSVVLFLVGGGLVAFICLWGLLSTRKKRMLKFIKKYPNAWEIPLLVEKYNINVENKRFKVDLDELQNQ